jgi:hypothetical protein
MYLSLLIFFPSCQSADAQSPLMKETLQQQYLVVKRLTDQSHVMQYGSVILHALTSLHYVSLPLSLSLSLSLLV